MILIPLALLFWIGNLHLIHGEVLSMGLQSILTVVLVEVTGIKIEKGTKRDQVLETIGTETLLIPWEAY
jgi:hypothetical protein